MKNWKKKEHSQKFQVIIVTYIFFPHFQLFCVSSNRWNCHSRCFCSFAAVNLTLNRQDNRRLKSLYSLKCFCRQSVSSRTTSSSCCTGSKKKKRRTKTSTKTIACCCTFGLFGLLYNILVFCGFCLKNSTDFQVLSFLQHSYIKSSLN